MIKLNVNHTRLTASNLEALVEGNIRSIFIKLIFSPEWEHLARIAVFSNGNTEVSVSLDSDTCAIPWEVLSFPGEVVVSLRGLGNSGEYVICTENESLGKVQKSNANSNVSSSEEATPDVIETLLADFAEIMENGGIGGGTGNGGVYVGETEPTDPGVRVWVRPNGKASLDTNIMEYRPYWRCLNTAGFVNAFATESYSTAKPIIEAVEENGTAYTEKLYAALPFPMKSAVMVGTTDRRYDVRGLNGNGTSPVVGEEYRLYSLYGNTEGEAISANVRLHLMGMIADVPEAPTIEADASGAAEDATAIAESYVNADIPFVYGKNWTYSDADNQVLIGESTRINGLKGGRMECDTFVDMILRGISYENSPYAENKAAVDAEPFVPVMLPFEDMADYDNPDSMTWVSWLLSNGRLYNNPYMTGSHGGAVRWAQDIAWFMWSINDGERACIFSDKTKAANGDIVFFKNAGKETFDNIAHVAYIGEDDGELYVYECTTEKAEHPTAVYKTKLSELARETAYFARLNYSAMTEGE